MEPQLVVGGGHSRFCNAVFKWHVGSKSELTAELLLALYLPMLKLIYVELRLLARHVEALVLPGVSGRRRLNAKRKGMQAHEQPDVRVDCRRPLGRGGPDLQSNRPGNLENIQRSALAVERGLVVVQWPSHIVPGYSRQNQLAGHGPGKFARPEMCCELSRNRRMVVLRDEKKGTARIPPNHTMKPIGPGSN